MNDSHKYADKTARYTHTDTQTHDPMYCVILLIKSAGKSKIKGD